MKLKHSKFKVQTAEIDVMKRTYLDMKIRLEKRDAEVDVLVKKQERFEAWIQSLIDSGKLVAPDSKPPSL